jgi:hypothetical protein
VTGSSAGARLITVAPASRRGFEGGGREPMGKSRCTPGRLALGQSCGITIGNRGATRRYDCGAKFRRGERPGSGGGGGYKGAGNGDKPREIDPRMKRRRRCRWRRPSKDDVRVVGGL